MNELNQLYCALLGLDDSRKVDDVDLDLAGSQVVMWLSLVGGKLLCPECGESCSQADAARRGY